MKDYLREVIERSCIISTPDHHAIDPYAELEVALLKLLRSVIAQWEAQDELQSLLEKAVPGASLTYEALDYISQVAANFGPSRPAVQDLDRLLILAMTSTEAFKQAKR